MQNTTRLITLLCLPFYCKILNEELYQFQIDLQIKLTISINLKMLLFDIDTINADSRPQTRDDWHFNFIFLQFL